jgi:endonuclease-3 related protein
MDRFGPTGWWPVVDLRRGKCVYDNRPLKPAHRFEIAVGAVLTQNISWKNVEKALVRLKREGMLSPGGIASLEQARLAEMIRSTGYHNQKAETLKTLVEWMKGYNDSLVRASRKPGEELRRELLALKRIGPETADSILLYALEKPFFVVDAYTRRIFTRLGLLRGREEYHQIQDLFHGSLPADLPVYREYHGLIVEEAKIYCKKNPFCGGCPCYDICPMGRVFMSGRGG